MALGGVGVSLLDLVTGFAALASDGEVRPLALEPDTPAPSGVRLVGAEAARMVTDILADAPRPPGIAAPAADYRRVSFKTGTSYGFRDAWAIGWTSRHVVGVWVGRVDGTPRPGAMGRTAAAPILFRAVDMIETPDHAPATAASFTARTAPHALSILAPAGAPPSIVYPVTDGIIQLPLREGNILPPIPLEASGGRPPYRWFVDGTPLPAAPSGHPTLWRPGREGFARVTVVDSAGLVATVTTQIRADRPG